MTALDHLRAVLAVTNDKAYRTAEDQGVIEQAKRYSELPDDAVPVTRAYLCHCCGQTARTREGHFAHAVAILSETARFHDDGTVIGARRDLTDDWVCDDPVCHRCRPGQAYAAWCADHPR